MTTAETARAPGRKRPAANPTTGRTCMAWIPRKWAIRRSPPVRDQPKTGTPPASERTPPIQWPSRDESIAPTEAPSTKVRASPTTMESRNAVVRCPGAMAHQQDRECRTDGRERDGAETHQPVHHGMERVADIEV